MTHLTLILVILPWLSCLISFAPTGPLPPNARYINSRLFDRTLPGQIRFGYLIILTNAENVVPQNGWNAVNAMHRELNHLFTTSADPVQRESIFGLLSTLGDLSHDSHESHLVKQFNRLSTRQSMSYTPTLKSATLDL
jgi:hypothetical protein